MLTLPEIVRRKKQPYLAIRSHLMPRQIKKQGPLFLSEVRAFMERKGYPLDGPAFFRYDLIAEDGQLDMEFGYVTARPFNGSGPVRSGMLPSGRHASVTWTGAHDRLGEVMTVLDGWGRETGTLWDARASDRGTEFANRIEVYHVGPDAEPEPGKWVTEVSIKVKTADED